MSTVDTKALRAHAEQLTEIHFEVGAFDGSLHAQGGPGEHVYPLDAMSREDKDAIVAILNAAPALLDELDMRRQQVDGMAEDQGKIELRAETAEAELDDTHSALCEVCSATDKDHDLPLRLSEMAETVVGWLKTAQSERDALRAENETLKAHEVEVTTDAVLAASENFALRSESDAMLAEIRRLEAENGRLREAARAVCEGTMSSEVALGLRILRAALAPRADEQAKADAGVASEIRAERDAPRARVAELEREVERVRAEVDFVRSNVTLIADKLHYEVKPFGPLYASSLRACVTPTADEAAALAAQERASLIAPFDSSTERNQTNP